MANMLCDYKEEEEGGVSSVGRRKQEN